MAWVPKRTKPPYWKLIAPSSAGGTILTEVYEDCMKSLVYSIKTNLGRGVFGKDGAKNLLSKSLSNVIIHLPLKLNFGIH